MRFVLVITFLLKTVCSWAQPDTTKTLIFKVTSKKYEVSISPNDSILWVGQPYFFDIEMTGGGTIGKVILQGGSITREKNNYLAYVKEGEEAVLGVYRKTADGKNLLVKSKTFKVKKIPAPEIRVCGVKTDSVVHPGHLINQDLLTASIDGFEDVELDILQFKMISFIDPEKPDTMTANGPHFTLPMRRAIHKLKAGNIIYFEDIYCQIKGEYAYRKAGDVQLFIADTDSNQVGARDPNANR